MGIVETSPSSGMAAALSVTPVGLRVVVLEAGANRESSWMDAVKNAPLSIKITRLQSIQFCYILKKFHRRLLSKNKCLFEQPLSREMTPEGRINRVPPDPMSIVTN